MKSKTIALQSQKNVQEKDELYEHLMKSLEDFKHGRFSILRARTK